MTEPRQSSDAKSIEVDRTQAHDRRSKLCVQVVDAMHAMSRLGLNRGTAGNASARFEGGMLISPSGVRTDQLTADTVVFVPEDERSATPQKSATRPSSEWRLHQAVFQSRPDVHGIVHCHSRFATVLACARRPIPAVHYLVGLANTEEVPVTPYARFGTEELAGFTAEALTASDACLLANHGLVACGRNLAQALALAEEIEEQAALYWHTLAIGGGTILSSPEMRDVLGALDAYKHS